MPRTRSLAWAELKIGVLTIAGIVITAAAVFMLTGSRGFFWERYRLKTQFGNAAGLKPGSPVRVGGLEVGSVSTVGLSGNRVDITFEVNKRMRASITDRSTAVLGAVSLLGEGAVDITPAAGGTPIEEWGYVPEGRNRGTLAAMAPELGTGIDEVTHLIQDIRGGKGTVGRLMTDEQLYVDLQQFVNSAGELARGLREGKGTMGKLLTDSTAVDALDASLKNIEALTQQINSGHGSIGKLLNDPSFANSLDGATINLRELTGRLNRGEGTAGKLMTDTSLFDRLTAITEKLDGLVGRLNAGQGTAGQLLQDRRLYENMNGAVVDLRSLVAEIRKDPKKYLNVKVSIF